MLSQPRLQLPKLLRHRLQFTKKPKNTLQNFQFQSLSSSSSSSSSTSMSSLSSSSPWQCFKCTFINPSSQKTSCQICLTPFSLSSSSSSPSKWSCKSCTFLNSYGRSNCEICDTRASLSSLSNLGSTDLDDDIAGHSVGSIFFPLRRCDSGRVQESDNLACENKVETQMGSDRFLDHSVELGGSRSSFSNKQKFHDPVCDNADSVSCSPVKKENNDVVMKGLASAKIAENAEGRATSKRKLCDLGSYIDKPIKVDGFREVKSSTKNISVLDSVTGFGIEKVRNVKTNSGSVSMEAPENAELESDLGAIKILSYNVWFREDLEVHKRMQAIGDLIQSNSPDIICFQEVTPNIYDIMQKSTWWKKYSCSASYERAASEVYFCMQLAKLPVKLFSCKQFSYSAMGRELCVAEIEVNQDKSLVVATSHLESPCPGPPTWDQMFSKERVNQAKEAIDFLQKFPNVIFCGDMNWDDKLDGRFPFVDGWFDAWEKLRPNEIGWTYDTKSNKMLTGNRALQKRLDRFICRLTDFKISCIDMIGTEAIPGLTYNKQKKMKNKIQELTLPVLPSDHFGLLLTITND